MYIFCETNGGRVIKLMYSHLFQRRNARDQIAADLTRTSDFYTYVRYL